MRVRIELEGNLRDTFTKIGLISKESMIEQSSKSGNRVREYARLALKASPTSWIQKYKKGKRQLLNTGKFNVSGRRIAHRKSGGTDDPENMSSLITSKTSEITGTTVIGGAHGDFTPNTIRDGKIVRSQKKVGAVDKRAIAILDKLNSGKQGKDLRWRKKGGGYSSKSIDNFDGLWKARHFMKKGWAMAQGYIRKTMTTELERLMGKRVNNLKVKKVKNAS